MTLDINTIARLAEKYNIPLEDVLFIALNVNGVNFECDYNRMRMALRLVENKLFEYANQRNELDYYFALPVNPESPFIIINNVLRLQDIIIGQVIELTEDICDSHYFRRKGTSLNINPNSRTSCRGCQFCYTAYQVPYDRKRLKTESDLKEFFENWLMQYNLIDLSHLIQVSVVTGCYESNKAVCQFLQILKKVLSEYRFVGKIFYLGSQITTQEQLESIVEIKPFSICFSLETFERRNLLKKEKRIVTLQDICKSMNYAQRLGYEVNFSYIVGMESLRIMEYHFNYFKEYINKFPTINTLQIHKYHSVYLKNTNAYCLDYYLDARFLLERLFNETNMRPLVWENYRSLWFLTFGNEELHGIRMP